MADLVLGVAKSLVEGTLSRAQSAIDEESQLRKSTRRDLVFITGEFQMMQCYLSSTTSDKVKNNVVSTCVAQLRDLSYDVEDGIEFVVHLDPKPDWWLRVIPSCIAPPRPLDEAAGIIEQLKGRVQDVRQRIAHYNNVSDSAGRPTPVAEKKQQQAAPAHVMDEDVQALTDLIIKKTLDLQVISLWVPGDDLEAASTTIRDTYSSSRCWTSFPIRAWVKVKQHTDEFAQTLWNQLQGSKSVQDLMETGQVRTTDQDYIRKALETDKYLVVLEDVYTEDEWASIHKCFIYPEMESKKNGSRLIVITKNHEIATSCTAGSPSLEKKTPYVQRFWADFSLCVFSKEGSLIGRDSEMGKLNNEYLKEACKSNVSQVISVWGMAGTGKSALVRSVYQDKISERKAERNNNDNIEKFGWVDVRHPFDLMAIYQSLFVQFKSGSPKINDEMVKECHSILKHKHCLVVIDNLQSKEDWDAIEDSLLFGPSRNIIIVITNDESIALYCAQSKERVFNVKALEECAGLDLFKTKVKGDSYLVEPEKNKMLPQLVSMSGGLPKILVALSDYLAEDPSWSNKVEELCRNFFVNLERRPEFTPLRDLFSSIHHYFCSCPDYLKPCMFYLSVFDKSQPIRRRRLVMRWIAEGYCKDKASATAEDVGEKIFAKITELSMINLPQEEETIVTGMRAVGCEVSAFFHEYIVGRRKEESVTFALEAFYLSGCCRQSTGRTGRHLLIEESWDRDRIVFETIDFSRLRSLTVYGKWESFFIAESMKVLRVLDLENADGVKNKDLEIMLKLLPRLKFLSLRGCSEINYLPASIGDLRQLQTLDIRYTSVVAIPASITKLEGLQYLRAGKKQNDQSAPGTVPFKLSPCQRSLQLVGVNVKAGIGKLTALHTVGVVNVGGAEGGNILDELKTLTQLRKMGVFGVCHRNRKKFFSAISDHSHLQSLSVWLKEKNEDALYDMPTIETKPPKELQSLRLYGPVNKLPKWIKELKTIKKLTLELDKLPPQDTEVLGKLEELCILRLFMNPEQGDILLKDGTYKKLKVLQISSRSVLRLTFEGKAMENLELLKVRSDYTGSQQQQLKGLKNLSKLKEIHVTCYQVVALMKHLEDQLFTDCSHMKHIFKLKNVKEQAGHQSKDNNVMPSNGGIIISLCELDETRGSRAPTGENGHANGSAGRNDQTAQCSRQPTEETS